MPRVVEKLSLSVEFESHFREINGHRLHYWDEGRGEPLLLVHGNPSWCYMYRRLVPLLSPLHRVIVPDHIGCGLSAKPPENRYPYTLAQRVADLQALVDSLELEGPISLLLHDWGGPIGMSYAARNPEKIGRIALLNTAGFLLPEGKSIHWSLRWCRRSRLAALFIRGLNGFSIGATRLGVQRGLSQQVRRAYRAPYDSWNHRIAVLRFIQDIPLDSRDTSYSYLETTGERLSDLREKPVAIFWGEGDFIFDLDFLEEWRRRFPEAEVHRFEKGGHYLLEDCFEEVAPRIVEFFERPA